MGIISGISIKSGFSRVSSSNDSSLSTINTKVIKDNTKEKATNHEARMESSSAINTTTSSATSGSGVSIINTEISTGGFSDVQSANGDVSAMQAEELQAYIQSLKGKMSQEQYDKFIEGIKDNLDIQIKEHEDILNGDGNNVGLIKKYNELNKIVERANRGTDTSITYSNSLEFKNECSKYGVENLSELINIRDDLGQKVSGLSMELNNLKSQKESAKYDYIGFLKDFDSFDYESFSNADLADFDKDAAVENIEKLSGNLADSAVVDTRTAYSYEAYKSKHPNVSPLQFVMMLEKLHGNEDYVVLGISDVESLTVVAQLYEYYPDLAKTYEYLYSQSPKKANEFINNCKYELNAFEGQLKAKEFFDDLSDLEGTNLDEAVANELGVSVEGLKDGLISFGEGVEYTVEAGETGVKKILKKLGLYDGEVEENRMLSSEEYKRMYILQMLMNKQDKINAGIIVKDDNGNYVNGDGSKILDYSKTFKGKFLSDNYEISQGIGNMIPSVMMTCITPTFGSVALGVSAGGNAYHGSMVEGQSYASSLLYGAFTGSSEAISERLLGGISGLSDVQLTGFRKYIRAAGKESVQESFQNILDKIYRVSAMGESLPTTAEEWKEFASDTFKQGVYAMITAGIMNVPSLAINSTRINSFKNELNANNLSYDDFLEAVKKGYDLPNIGELEAVSYFGDEYIELSTRIKDNSQSSIPVEASNSDVKSFNSMQDAANYFSDPNLYLVGVLYDKYVSKDIDIARDDMYKLRKQVYLNEPSAIEQVKTYLNMEELATYQNIAKNKDSGIQQSWIDSLTESERFSIRFYAEMFGSIDAWDAMEKYNYDSNGSSVTLPELMRKGFTDGDPNIDSAIEKFGVLPEEIQVYRTVASDALTSQFGELDLDNLQSLIGKTYKDKAYMSTSLIEKSARSANFGEGQKVLMKITVPTDANYGAYIESLSNLSYNQMEFLIKKNSTSTIENAYLDEDGRIVVEMKLFTPFDNSRTTSKPLLPIVENLVKSGKLAEDEVEHINNKFIEDNYKFYSSMATNESDGAKAILEKIKNGYEPNQVDLMELIESDPVKLAQYKKIYDIRSRINENGNITESDLNYLLTEVGFSPEISNLIYNLFDYRGLVSRNEKGANLSEIERLGDDIPEAGELNKDYSIIDLNLTVQSFLESHGINVEELWDKADTRLLSLNDINRIANNYGFFEKAQEMYIGIDEIVGYNYDTNPFFSSSDLIYNLNDLFNSGGDNYSTRSLGMLEYSSDEIVNKLLRSFYIEPIEVVLVDGKYVISDNGIHRFSILKTLYLSELVKANGNQQKIEELQRKFEIPVNVSKMNEIITYSDYMLGKFFGIDLEKTITDNKEWIIYVETDNGIQYLDENQLLSYVSKLLNDVDPIEFRNFYDRSPDSFKNYINNTYPYMLTDNPYSMPGFVISRLEKISKFEERNSFIEDRLYFMEEAYDEVSNEIDSFVINNRYDLYRVIEITANKYGDNPNDYNFQNYLIGKILAGELSYITRDQGARNIAIKLYSDYKALLDRANKISNERIRLSKEHTDNLGEINKLKNEILTNKRVNINNLDKKLEELNIKNGYYGANQGVTSGRSDNDYFYYSIDEYGERIKKGYSIYFDLKNAIKNQYNFRHASDVAQIISGFNNTGACSYAATANEIFSYYLDKPEQFEQDFGYSMYTTIDGQKTLNSARLLVDLYIFENSEENGGTLFKRDSQGYMHITVDALSDQMDVYYRRKLNANNQKYMSRGSTGKQIDLIDNFLKSKNPRLSYDSVIISTGLNRGDLSSSELSNMINDSIGVINDGGQLELDIFSGRPGKKDIIMKSLTNNIPDMNTKNWNGGGHAVFVTAIDADGFIVSSWGNKYKILFKDLRFNSFTLNAIKIMEN